MAALWPVGPSVGRPKQSWPKLCISDMNGVVLLRGRVEVSSYWPSFTHFVVSLTSHPQSVSSDDFQSRTYLPVSWNDCERLLANPSSIAPSNWPLYHMIVMRCTL